MMDVKKEEANKVIADKEAELAQRINVLDIKVEDNFNLDDI